MADNLATYVFFLHLDICQLLVKYQNQVQVKSSLGKKSKSRVSGS